MQNWPANKVERWPVERLVPYARNARTHSDEQVAQVAASIREWGWTNPVLVGEDGGIIAGHCRVLAARQLGIAEVPIMVAAGWSAAQKRAYTLADNQLTLNAGWNPEMLRLELGELKALEFDLGLIGFGDAELAALTANPGLTDPDEVPEAPAVPVAQLGEVWQLGRHWLVCGDATKAEDVGKALGGVRAHLVFTDPPYGVDYDGGTTKREKLIGDETTSLYGPACQMAAKFSDKQSALYLWHAGVKGIAAAAAAAAAAMAAGYEIRCELVWNKNQAQFGALSAQYKQKHEPCYYCFRRGTSPRWYGPTNETTVWDCDRASRNDFHPTQKPTQLAERAIKNSSEAGQIVLDLFVGSGSTIIAAEMTGRSCHALEINPTYCDVTIERWQNFTGEKARRQE